MPIDISNVRAHCGRHDYNQSHMFDGDLGLSKKSDSLDRQTLSDKKIATYQTHTEKHKGKNGPLNAVRKNLN